MKLKDIKNMVNSGIAENVTTKNVIILLRYKIVK